MATTHAPKARNIWAVRWLQILVFVAMFSGFVNLVPSPIAPATLIIDGLCCLLLFGAIVILARGGRIEAWPIRTALAAAVALVLAVFSVGTLGPGVIAVRNLFLYASAGLFAAVSLTTKSDALAVVRTVMGAGLTISAFGVVQFALRSSLPPWLLYSSDTSLFGYWGTDITRSTGLVGNSIVYGTVALLTFMLWMCASFRPNLTQRTRFWHLAATVVSALGVLVSFSRFSIAAMVVGLVSAAMVALWRRGVSNAVPVIFSVALLGCIALLASMTSPALQMAVEKSFIVQGLFGGGNESVAGSTAGHDLFTQLALQSFSEHPWVGVGIGSQSGEANQVIITDGFHLQTLVEGGLALTVVMVLTYLAVLGRLLGAWKALQHSAIWLPIALTLFFASQVLVAGFFNTGFYGKVPNVVFWIAFGACVALARTDGPPSLHAPVRANDSRKTVARERASKPTTST